MSKPPKIVIPGLNRGAGIPGGYILGRRRGSKQGPAELLNLTQIRAIGIATTTDVTTSTSLVASIAHSETISLSRSISTSLSAISGSLSGVVSSVTSLSSAVSTVDSGEKVSLSQISSSLSGAISSTTSLSSAVSTVISGSISAVNSRVDSLSTAVGGGGGVDDDTALSSSLSSAVSINTTQSTSLSQISSSLSGAISSTTSLSAVAGYLGAPQNIQNGTYTTVLADRGKHIYHTSGSAHTWTIDSNANVAYEIGAILTFVNESGGGVVTLAITADTLRWSSSTGSRSLAANGTASALKVATTAWRLTGDGIT